MANTAKQLLCENYFDSFDIKYYITEGKLSENEIPDQNGKLFYGALVEKVKIDGTGESLECSAINISEDKSIAMEVINTLYHNRVTTVTLIDCVNDLSDNWQV